MPLDLTVPATVLAGTIFGECRGGGRPGMEDVAAVIMNRVAGGWQSNVIAVCLAHAQFSCWTDSNRQVIEAAETNSPSVWGIALDIADDAMGGTLTNRVCGADSYYALTMRHPAFWAKPPGRHVYSDRWHSFWTLEHARPVAPNTSIHGAEGYTIT